MTASQGGRKRGLGGNKGAIKGSDGEEKGCGGRREVTLQYQEMPLPTGLKVVVIGAGMSGLKAAFDLQVRKWRYSPACRGLWDAALRAGVPSKALDQGAGISETLPT